MEAFSSRPHGSDPWQVLMVVVERGIEWVGAARLFQTALTGKEAAKRDEWQSPVEFTEAFTRTKVDEVC